MAEGVGSNTSKRASSGKMMQHFHNLMNWSKMVLINQLVGESARVLQANARRGEDTRKLLRHQLDSLLVCDPSPENIERARQRVAKAGAGGELTPGDAVTFRVADFKDEHDFPDMDVVWLNHDVQALLTAPTRSTLLANVSGALRPGGICFAIILDSSTIWCRAQTVQGATGFSGALFSIAFNTNQLDGSTGSSFRLHLAGESANEFELTHFPTLYKEALSYQLQVVDVVNLKSVYDMNCAIYWEGLVQYGAVDKKGRLFAGALDLLELYAVLVMRRIV